MFDSAHLDRSDEPGAGSPVAALTCSLPMFSVLMFSVLMLIVPILSARRGIV